MDTHHVIAGRSVRFSRTGPGSYAVTIAGRTARETKTAKATVSPNGTGALIVASRDLWNVDLWADVHGTIHCGKPPAR